MGVLSSLAAKITNLGIPAALKNINIANLIPISVRDQAVNTDSKEGTFLDNRVDRQTKEAMFMNKDEFTVEIEKHQAPIISKTKTNEELLMDDLRDLYRHSAEFSEKFPEYANHSPLYQELKSAVEDSRSKVAQTGKPLSEAPPAYSHPSKEYEKLTSSFPVIDISGYSGPAGHTSDWTIPQRDNSSSTSNRGNKVLEVTPAYSEKLAKLSVEANLPQELTKSGLKTIGKEGKDEQIKAESTPTIEGKGKGSAPGK